MLKNIKIFVLSMTLIGMKFLIFGGERTDYGASAKSLIYLFPCGIRN